MKMFSLEIYLIIECLNRMLEHATDEEKVKLAEIHNSVSSLAKAPKKDLVDFDRELLGHLQYTALTEHPWVSVFTEAHAMIGLVDAALKIEAVEAENTSGNPT